MNKQLFYNQENQFSILKELPERMASIDPEYLSFQEEEPES